MISIKDFDKAAKSLPTIEENNINEIGSYYADWIMQDAPQEITKQSKEDIIIKTYFDPKFRKMSMKQYFPFWKHKLCRIR